MNEARLTDALAAHWGVAPADVRVRIEPLSGGLENLTLRADVQCTGAAAGAVPPSLVVKQLTGRSRREAAIYAMLHATVAAPPLPRIIAALAEADLHYLVMEEIRGPSWPWAQMDAPAAVCRELARLHGTAVAPAAVADWDYEQDLAESAQETLALAETVPRTRWPRLRELRRLVTALPEIRRRLLDEGATLIHGDVHPGNVMIARHPSATPRVVFLDWGRSRIGSPLEDLASWLHSLGCWEPEARRRHDTLLRAYLRAARVEESPSQRFRNRYALAAACNGLAGAVRYHLAVLGDAASPADRRYDSGIALAAWQRTMRRAAAALRDTRDR